MRQRAVLQRKRAPDHPFSSEAFAAPKHTPDQAQAEAAHQPTAESLPEHDFTGIPAFAAGDLALPADPAADSLAARAGNPAAGAMRHLFAPALAAAERDPAPAAAPPAVLQRALQTDTPDRPPDQTGLPPELKAGVEQLSSLSLDAVRVHYNAHQPSQVGALAYTQGQDIYVGPGQEQHLPHEAWHVVQQAQGRVSPSTQDDGLPVNDDQGLEREADTRGAEALARGAPARAGTAAALRPPPAAPTMTIQKVEDPTGVIIGTLRAAYNKVRSSYGSLVTLPTPSKINGSLKDIVNIASDEDNAYQRFAEYIVKTYFKNYPDDVREGYINQFAGIAVDEAEKVAATQKKQAREMEKLRKLKKAEEAEESDESDETEDSDEPKPSRKRARSTSTDDRIKAYPPAKREQLIKKLKTPTMQQKLFSASMQAHEKHRAKGRASVRKAAQLNKLETVQPLSTSDMALAQASYTHERTGDALLLERGKDYQVTMTRGGGQEVHQLGPYLPAPKKPSVQSITEELLENTNLSSLDLAQAISTRDPSPLIKSLTVKPEESDEESEESEKPKKSKSSQRSKKSRKPKGHYISKVRAMRHLIEIEKSRGPEVALATSLEHRSALHGFTHISDYPRRTPLGPPKATTDLRLARERAREEQELSSDDLPTTYNYLPKEISQRASTSTLDFLSAFVKDPQQDAEVQSFLSVLDKESTKSAKPSEELIDATADIMRTPLHISAMYEDD